MFFMFFPNPRNKPSSQTNLQRPNPNSINAKKTRNKSNKPTNLQQTHKLINFTLILSNSYSKFILIMNTREQHKNNKPKIFNPKNKRIETQNIPKFVHKFFHKNQLHIQPKIIILIQYFLWW